jgi:FkbM family methyltransferase
MSRLPVKPGTSIPFCFDDGNLLLTHPERCSIAKKMFWDNGVRKPVEDQIAINLFSKLSKKADIILDIGANSGLFSLVSAIANPNAKIIAFDILPEAYHILIDNLMFNNLLSKVEVRLVGIGKKGEIFYAPFNNISSEMPSSLSLGFKPILENQVKVSVMSLDEVCIPQFLDTRMLIKIDVEGTEFDIFDNAEKTLKVIKPDFICEVLPIAKKFEVYDKILDDYGYQKYLITDTGLVKQDRIKPDLHFKDWYFTRNNLN